MYRPKQQKKATTSTSRPATTHMGASERTPLKIRYAPNSRATSRASSIGMPAAERRVFSFIEGLVGALRKVERR
jgi:hypothetical protein